MLLQERTFGHAGRLGTSEFDKEKQITAPHREEGSLVGSESLLSSKAS